MSNYTVEETCLESMILKDEDDGSVASETSGTGFNPSERDEKKEVYKMSAKDTSRVRRWRGAMTLVLLLTALGVTLTTYKLLKDEERNNFEVAVSPVEFTMPKKRLL